LKDYVIIHTQEQKIIALINLKAINSQLPADIFFRVNKSYIVNTKHISSLNSNHRAGRCSAPPFRALVVERRTKPVEHVGLNRKQRGGHTRETG
jgi:hypothetical protein